MKRTLIPALILAFAPCVFAEGPADDVKAAAKKLAESGSYSWTTSSPGRDGGPGMSLEGKTDKGGAACLKTTFGERSTETIIKGGKAAVKMEDGWKSGEELAAEAPSGGGGGGGRGLGGRFAARMAETFKTPAATVETLVEGTKELKKDGDAISGDLTEEAAKAQLTFGRGRRGGDSGGNTPPAPSNAKGSVKFWIKDGVLTKYEVTVSGSMEWNGQSRDINRTSTTEFKDVGSTKLEIPAEAAAKLTGAEEKKEEPKKEEPKKEEAPKKEA